MIKTDRKNTSMSTPKKSMDNVTTNNITPINKDHAKKIFIRHNRFLGTLNGLIKGLILGAAAGTGAFFSLADNLSYSDNLPNTLSPDASLGVAGGVMGATALGGATLGNITYAQNAKINIAKADLGIPSQR